MNSVFKFSSLDKFDYNQWRSEVAGKCVDDSLKQLSRRGITVNPQERAKLIDIGLNKKGMTQHFYYSMRVTEKDVASIRPKVEKKEEPKEIKK